MLSRFFGSGPLIVAAFLIGCSGGADLPTGDEGPAADVPVGDEGTTEDSSDDTSPDITPDKYSSIAPSYKDLSPDEYMDILGAKVVDEGINFAVYSENATRIEVLLSTTLKRTSPS